MLERKSSSDRAETPAAAHAVATDPHSAPLVPPLYLSKTSTLTIFWKDLTLDWRLLSEDRLRR
ncbi:hypothetical protein CN934_07345 [Ensifer sp. MMN_5]|nr:hypothetical protein CN934_07345 [Ensifer sp. MMN_5]PND26673.1 hypothetical protein CN933_12975 [Sinorhizobium sp. M4_45]